MSIDLRTRSAADVSELSADELFDVVLPEAIARHGDLAARGLTYLGVPALGLEVDGRRVTLDAEAGMLVIQPGTDSAQLIAVLSAGALSDLFQDLASAMGLAMTSRVKIVRGSINDWISWEPVLRALLDGRKVHETGDVTFVDLEGRTLDLGQVFTVDDDRDEMRQFLEEAGFLHLRGVFDQSEMAALGDDVDDWISRARPDDGESWWATDAEGAEQAVRVLFFYDKSAVLRRLVEDDRFAWIGGLTGDGHVHSGGGEGLVKPLGIERGLSDLPWHKDCGQGRHSYFCNGLTCGISVTGADRVSGALGVIPGSHRANTMSAGRDRRLDLESRMLETETGDVTVHCSDTLHRAYPPIDRPRKVVYTGFSLPARDPGAGRADPASARAARAARAALSDVQARIEAADNDDDPHRYRARRGH
jgi:hypothetical protein